MTSDRKFWVEKLAKAHRRAQFSCSNADLNRYIRELARQDTAKSVSVVYVLTNDGITVAGFYTLSQSSIDLRSLSDSLRLTLPKYPDVPVTLLGRLAIDDRFRGVGLGEMILLDALKRAYNVASIVAAAMVLVDAKNESSRKFYRLYGFEELREFPNRMVLPMDTIRTLVMK